MLLRYVHMHRRAGLQPTNPADDQFYRIVDVRKPTRPKRLDAGGCPARAWATPRLACAPPQVRLGLSRAQHQRLSQRPDRAYVGYISGAR